MHSTNFPTSEKHLFTRTTMLMACLALLTLGLTSCGPNPPPVDDGPQPQMQDPTKLDAYQVTPKNPDSLYYDPVQPPELRPVELPVNEALNEVPYKNYLLRFDTVYFGSEQIKVLLEDENAVGVRFITSLSEDEKTGSILAIGVDSLRRNLYSNDRQFIRSDGMQNGDPTYSELDSAVAHKEATNADNNTIGYSVYFSRTALNDLMGGAGVEGIYLIPGRRRFAASNGDFEMTFIAAAARPGGILRPAGEMIEKQEFGFFDFDQDTEFSKTLKSKQPCPPDCYPYEKESFE